MEQDPNSTIDPVEEASQESFPASDSPAWAMDDGVAIKNNEAEKRFEQHADGKIAYLTYSLRPSTIILIHTEVPAELEGNGLGSQLARAGLDFARARGLDVVPLCPFIAKYISRHPEYMDLVPTEHRGRVESS